MATTSEVPPTASERFLRIMLRAIGSVSLLALPFVAVPYSWMNAIHAALGMGALPSEPVVGYLARSTSAFYALLGGLLWVVSFDLRRYRPVLCYLSVAVFLLGVLLLIVDWMEGMPLFWRLGEGPFVIAMGIGLSIMSRALPEPGR